MSPKVAEFQAKTQAMIDQASAKEASYVFCFCILRARWEKSQRFEAAKCKSGTAGAIHRALASQADVTCLHRLLFILIAPLVHLTSPSGTKNTIIPRPDRDCPDAKVKDSVMCSILEEHATQRELSAPWARYNSPIVRFFVVNHHTEMKF